MWAETADFENSLPEGWETVGTMTYYDRPKTGSYSIGNAMGSGWDTNRGNYIKTTKLVGNITLWLRSYKSNTTGYVVLFKLSDDGETVGDKLVAFSSSSTTFAEKSYTLSEATRLAIVINYAHIDDMTYEEYVNGPKLKVMDGTTSLTSPYSYNFGLLSDGGATKQFTLANPGTQDLTVAISGATDFNPTLTTTTLTANGGTATLTLTMPSTTASGSLVITPDAASNLDAFTINVSGTVRDASKYYTNFADGFGDWVAQKNGNYEYWTTSPEGYAKHSYRWGNLDLTSPELTFAQGETVMFRAQYNSADANGTTPQLSVYLSEDGTNWESTPVLTVAASELTADATQWVWKFFTVASADYKYFKFNGRLIKITDVYGGQLPAAVAVTGVSFDNTIATLQVGETTTLTATVSPADAKNKNVIWSTSDASVATVANGVVTAVAVGTATITVTTEDGGFTATCDVTVNPVAVTGVSLNQTELTLVEGKTATLIATVAPDNAANKNITWSTSDAAVATVNNGTVTAVAAGTATITVTTEDGSFTATCAVTVNAPAAATMDITLNGEEVPATVEFGNVNKAKTLTFNVANNGDMNLSGGNIALSGADAASFSLSKTYLMVAAHGTNTFDVTFNSTDEDVQKTATITLTTGELTKSFTVTGTYVNMWSEDFEGENPLVGWDANGFTIETQSGIGYSPVDLPSHFAVASYNGTSTIVTPMLSAHAGDELSFDAYFYWGDENNILNIEYSEDRNTWTSLYIYNANTYSNKSTNRMTITAPIEGSFYLRFTGKYSVGLDNFEGFKLAAAKEHEAEITTTTIPATGNQYVEYTASVDVKVLGTSDEELTAKFFIGDTQYGEDVVKTVTSGETETFTVTFTPDAAVSGDAYFTITNNDIDLTTGTTVVTIAPALALSETDEENQVVGQDAAYPVVELTFTVKDGWNSIALPFAVSDPTVFGESVRVYRLKSFAEGTLSFSEGNDMLPCTPYIIYVEGAKTGPFLFNNVSISTYLANVDFCTSGEITSGEYRATHKGTWTKMSAEGLYGIVNATGDIRLGTSNATFKAFRSYFDLTYPEGTSIKMNFVNNDGVSTTINAAEVLNELNGDIYDMSGRKVSKVQKGIYIQNGKKVVIK